MKNREIHDISEVESIPKYQELKFTNVLAISALLVSLSAPDLNKKETASTQQQDEEQIHPDLDKIHQLESSSGKNFKHPVVNHGLNRGDRAGGGFGVMPITARETIRKNPLLRKKYAKILNMSNKQITSFLNSDKRASKDIANSHWNKLLKVFPKDRLRRAYAWNCGVTCALKASNKEVVNNSYVKKFIKISSK
jgi:hypothetical protein